MKRMLIVTSLLLVLVLLIGGFGCKAPVSPPAPAPAPTVTVTATPTPTPTPAPAEKITLKFSSVFPQTAAASTQDKFIMDEITKRSNGRIQWETYWGSSLYSSAEQLYAVKMGIADMAHFIWQLHPAEFALNMVGSYVLFNSDDLYLLMAVQKAILAVPEVTQEFTKQNLKVLAYKPVTPYWLMTKVPVANLAEMKGKKIAVLGDALGAFVGAAGATGVPMGGTDRYTALERGTVDGHLHMLNLAESLKLQEVTKYFLKWENPSLGGLPGGLETMNIKTWDKLSDADKKLFEQVCAEADTMYIEYQLKMESQLLNTFQTKYGFTLLQFDAKDWATWSSAVPDIAQKWVEDMTAKGLPARKVMDVYLDMYAKAGFKLPPGWGKP